VLYEIKKDNTSEPITILVMLRSGATTPALTASVQQASAGEHLFFSLERNPPLRVTR
jgi:hypothetical protein